MSFQDVPSRNGGNNRNGAAESAGAVPFLRMRRNHPPKLPRVQAIPFTPPASTTPWLNGGSSNARGRSVERNMNKNRRSNVSERVLDDDLIDSYELKLSNSNSSYSETSVLDPYIESRDDYESFGPDRSQPETRYSRSSTKPTATRQNRKGTKHEHNNSNNTLQHYNNSHISNQNSKSSTFVSTFAKLTHEMQQYQKLVTDLEYIIRDAIMTPEVAWRTNILVKSVEETDSGIQEQLVRYEQSMAQQERLLHYNNNQRAYPNDKKRMTQQLVACTKLRRDFNRCHDSMTISLQTYKMRQKAEVSQLGAVQWNVTNRNGSNVAMDTSSLPQQRNPKMEEDFFERTMRQKELERMNESMRKVNDIYHGLAGLVNGQQERVDQLDDRVHDSQAHVQSGYDEYNCYVTRQNGWNALCGDMNEWGQSDANHDRASTTHIREPGYASIEKLRIHETFYWSMPLETMAEDWISVQNDFIGIGKHFFTHCCQRLDCCNDE